MPAAPIAAGVGAIGDVVSATSAKNQQNQDNQAANQANAAENQVIQAMSGSLGNIANMFFGQNGTGGAAGAMGSLMQKLMGGLGQPYGNQYTQAGMNAANGMANIGSNPYNLAAAGVAGGLENFQGLKQPELSALNTSMGNAGASTVKTMMSQLGGAANPNALAQTLNSQNQQSNMQMTGQLGALASEQELAAQQSAGNLFSGLGQTALSGLEGAGSLYGTFGEQTLQNQGQMLSGLQGLFGEEGSLLESSLGDEFGIANLYGNAAQGAANRAQSLGSPWGQALQGIAGQMGGMGGFGGGAGASTGTGGGFGIWPSGLPPPE